VDTLGVHLAHADRRTAADRDREHRDDDASSRSAPREVRLSHQSHRRRRCFAVRETPA
jgi:hypothetical protein